ncbi:winged-helix domain-containing protein [Halobacterium hubeiense]|uniref:winged-helix domain-containing protein n=1 Tax=Halobacterium hubeiense TaxID=1407499 RepID=UPI000B7E2F08|nr:winged-helix domain-containing protein [Halobacterium hubeiense]
MSPGRDEAGRFEETITEQDVLKVFDYEDDRVLTAPEVAEGLRRFGKQITAEGVRNRLEKMSDEGLVSRKKLGARAVGWWAEVAPELEAKTAKTVEKRNTTSNWDPL